MSAGAQITWDDEQKNAPQIKWEDEKQEPAKPQPTTSNNSVENAVKSTNDTPAWQRFGSGAMAGLSSLNPLKGGWKPLAINAVESLTMPEAALAKPVMSAIDEYKRGRTQNQGVIPSAAGALGSAIGLDTQGIRDRAAKGDIAGVVGEGVPSIAATVLGGEAPGAWSRLKGEVPRLLRGPGANGEIEINPMSAVKRELEARVPRAEPPDARGEMYDELAQRRMSRGEEQGKLDAAHESELSAIEKSRQKELAAWERLRGQHAQSLMGRPDAIPQAPGGGSVTMPRPLRPLIGSPEEWQSYDQQLNILRPEAKDAGLYHAARGSANKATNLQERLGRKFQK